MTKKKFLIGSLILFTLFIGSIIYDLIDLNSQKEKIASFNLKLSGKIIDKQSSFAGHNYGYILIDLEKCNYGDFDPRKKNQEYFFIIKNNKCLLILSGISELENNDSIVLNKDTYDVFRNGENLLKNSALVMPSSIYYDDATKLLNKANR